MHLVIRPSHFRRDLSTCVRIEQKDGWAMRSEKNSDSETDTQVDDPRSCRPEPTMDPYHLNILTINGGCLRRH